MRKWIDEKKNVNTITLQNESLFILHPLDENPMHRLSDNECSQIMHGNIKVKEGQLSIALVYTCVNKESVYHNVTDIKTEDYSLNDPQIISLYQRFDETIMDF